jgi:hemoglobin-like flavoprotein
MRASPSARNGGCTVLAQLPICCPQVLACAESNRRGKRANARLLRSAREKSLARSLLRFLQRAPSRNRSCIAGNAAGTAHHRAECCACDALPGATEEDDMTPEQVALVQNSFAKVAPIADAAADIFYDRLFTIAPEVQPLFPADMKEQKKKLIAMLATAVNNLHQVNVIVPAVQELGKRHAGYGVTAKQYEPVGAALIWTLERGLGPAFTPPVKAAWTEAYMTLAGVMQQAAADAPARKVG